jgi:ubiquinol-cytochrome c reductase cytochrome c subunit
MRRWLPHGAILLLAAAGGVFLWSHQSRASAAGPRTAAPAANAMTIYLRDCAVCHGADATGTTRGPSLQGVGRAAVDYWVSTGRMPLYGNTGHPFRSPAQYPKPGQLLPDSQGLPNRHPPAYPPEVISQLDDYVVSLTGVGPDIPAVNLQAANLAVGGGLFREQCAACHAWGGDGGALLHLPAPALHQATPVQIAEAIRTGPGLMPAFGQAAISDQDLNSVVAYVRYLDHPSNRGGNSLWHIGPVAEGGIAWVVAMGAVLVVVRKIGERS